jgi:hypothetical protein
MNTKVLEKIYKGNVELSEVNVDLALIDELKKGVSELNKILSEEENLKNKFNQLKQEGQSLITRSQSSKKTLQNFIDKFSTSAKDLGIDPKADINFRIAEENIKIADNVVKNINTNLIK